VHALSDQPSAPSPPGHQIARVDSYDEGVVGNGCDLQLKLPDMTEVGAGGDGVVGRRHGEGRMRWSEGKLRRCLNTVLELIVS
jgi:hypothetical protein